MIREMDQLDDDIQELMEAIAEASPKGEFVKV